MHACNPIQTAPLKPERHQQLMDKSDSVSPATFCRQCSPPSGCGVRSTSTTSSCRSPSTAPGLRGTLTSTTARGKRLLRRANGSIGRWSASPSISQRCTSQPSGCGRQRKATKKNKKKPTRVSAGAAMRGSIPQDLITNDYPCRVCYMIRPTCDLDLNRDMQQLLALKLTSIY